MLDENQTRLRVLHRQTYRLTRMIDRHTHMSTRQTVRQLAVDGEANRLTRVLIRLTDRLSRVENQKVYYFETK